VNVAGAPSGPSLTPKEAAWVRALAADLTRNPGASVVMAGPTQPAVVHALAHAINGAVGAFGATVLVTDPVVARPEVQADSLRELVTDMSQGKVQVLLIVGANPVYDAPADLPFARALETVGFRAHWGLYDDETANLCHWHVPATHELEAWGDARSFDGTVSLIQPLIAPLYEGKTATEFLSVLLGESGKTAFDHVREYWQAARGGADFEAWWNTALHDGVIAGSEAPVRTVGAVSAAGWTLPTPGSGTYLALRPDPSVGDGRWANNGWLQELSKPITHLTWENVALLSPRLAESLRVSNGDVVEVKAGATAVTIPAWILPGQPESVVTLHLGYGRTRAGRVGTGIGVSGYPLRSTAAPGHVSGVALRKTGKKVKLACTQNHHSMEGRHLVRSNTLAEHNKNSHWPHELGHHEPAADMTMYEGFKYPGNAWGLAVDLTSCTGCNACVVACQAENSIPVVGKEQVWRGREMAWLRIDRYFEGPIDEPELHYQPIMCQQCENAPCEAVCPVSATVHNHEGLNDMAYNRCVGTRYCSNNCPYKVRRFNFLKYSDETTPQYKLMRNPEVTIRTRGVMEKCTYCVQRINTARIEARTQGRPLKDGDIVTACQQACPAEAIVFGDINDPTSLVAQMKSDPLNYGILTDLNTRPRTTYLAELRNPNPDLEGHS
jgi:Fe-S-cluster-containing dehydrogenase component